MDFKLVVLIVISIVESRVALLYGCDNSENVDGYCLITSLEPAGDPVCRIHFPSSRSIKIQFAHLGTLSARLMYRMENVTKLDIAYSNIRTAYLKPDLTFLRISRSELEQLIVDPLEDNQLLELYLPENQLDRLPPNLNQLKKLTGLDLSNNRISFIDFNDLAGLTNLQILVLFQNHIKVVFSSGEVKLPALAALNLSKNGFHVMDISRLEARDLKEIDVSGNQMTRLEHLIERFPNLEDVNLNDNPWNCLWRDSFVETITNASWALSNGILECYEPDQEQLSAHRWKQEAGLRYKLQNTLQELVLNATGEEYLEFDEVVDAAMCKIFG